MSECTCSQIMLGTKPSGNLNLDLDCPIHGTDSPWYNSLEQVQKRADRSQRLRDLYEKRKSP
jgi:hypothetical protein